MYIDIFWFCIFASILPALLVFPADVRMQLSLSISTISAGKVAFSSY